MAEMIAARVEEEMDEKVESVAETGDYMNKSQAVRRIIEVGLIRSGDVEPRERWVEYLKRKNLPVSQDELEAANRTGLDSIKFGLRTLFE